jgi:flagellar basal body P-ring protein FlgI
VDIGAVVVTHKNIVVETGPSVSSQRFKSIETADAPNPKLKSLIECLNSIHAQPADIIDIIKGLERNGKLHAQLIIE